MESPKVLNQPATPILIFFLTISLMFSVSGAVPYDYMQYVVQWQPAVCSNPLSYKRCTKLANQSFTIHGLWPSNYNGASVTQQGGQAFDINELSPIKPQLDKCWPSMFRENDEFWRQEWSTHGTYSLNYGFSSQLEYFDQAVELCNSYNDWIGDILKTNGINPSDSTPVKSTDIADAIYYNFSKSPALRCSKRDGSVDGRKNLLEVVLCFNVNGEDMVDCPRAISACPSYIYFLSSATESSAPPSSATGSSATDTFQSALSWALAALLLHVAI
ncbi:hypothetical protein SLEP1_g53449 [Rubroshorea leprosula]|uniref:Uncharacterized protein n=1 Tax=Rubroshorea leprosula TaxID=152421 RepID=A0AAV5MAE4_9ROSI|nr:hypothetical protein SLEP1_g53449 [Rubroshorea leprosula]